jgi:hypothetical protein
MLQLFLKPSEKSVKMSAIGIALQLGGINATLPGIEQYYYHVETPFAEQQLIEYLKQTSPFNSGDEVCRFLIEL